jgi:hypothetical protein
MYHFIGVFAVLAPTTSDENVWIEIICTQKCLLCKSSVWIERQ